MSRTFANGGAGMRVLDVGAAMGAQQSVVDWMLKPTSGGSSPLKKGPDSHRGQRGAAKR